MKIGVFAFGSISPNRDDQWLSARGEGRGMINAGFGFGQMGHEVDIVCQYFSDRDNVMPGVNLRKSFDGNTMYDILLSYNTRPPIQNYKKLLMFIEPSNRKDILAKLYNDYKSAIFLVAAKNTPDLNSWAKSIGMNIKNIACTLFPIPCLPGLENQDFKPFHFDKNKKEISAWVYVSGWNNYYIPVDQYMHLTLRHLYQKYGYRISVNMIVGGSGNPFSGSARAITNEFKTNIVYNEKINYKDMLDIIDSSDICLTKGGPPYCGLCSFDAVSLGKMFFYFTHGYVNNNLVNDLYPVEDYCIRAEQGEGTARDKIDRAMSNPEASHAAFRKAIERQAFPSWSKEWGALLESIK